MIFACVVSALFSAVISSSILLELRGVGLSRRFLYVPEHSLPPQKSAPLSAHELIVKTLRTTMNSVTRAGRGSNSYDVVELRRHVRNGGALMCTGMAKLFIGNLKELGIPARRVSLCTESRRLGGYSYHSGSGHWREVGSV